MPSIHYFRVPGGLEAEGAGGRMTAVCEVQIVGGMRCGKALDVGTSRVYDAQWCGGLIANAPRVR